MVVPHGACEQYGRRLSFYVDTFQISWITEEAARHPPEILVNSSVVKSDRETCE